MERIKSEEYDGLSINEWLAIEALKHILEEGNIRDVNWEHWHDVKKLLNESVLNIINTQPDKAKFIERAIERYDKALKQAKNYLSDN